MKQNIIKYIGIGLIVLGSAALYIGGADQGTVVELVGGVFVIGGIITALIKKGL